MDADFVRAVMVELVRCMESRTTPWGYRVLASWSLGDDIYLVYTNTATDLILGEVLNVQDLHEDYGGSNPINLANVIFAADVESNPYYELSSTNAGLQSSDHIYWFGSTEQTRRIRVLGDTDEKNRRR